ncbi:S-layer homology domain-containing protein [Paenibacillus lignilyticus]|uniref:S-layer homology domain-containing protein n=1 Tax=Paenibacillus lignilyticus TaxID=1172615 RepID=A0ABS5CHL0_9BACL|nr:S-layer homology domain-containing protein [Paenibacillus lignilyticus]MBP3965302.1 S-layer homology domain-containing protein [Paenibacillus lignilyticus]
MNRVRNLALKSLLCVALIVVLASTSLNNYSYAEETAASSAVQITSGLKHIPGVKSFKTIINRAELPEQAQLFTHITVQSSNAPFAVNEVGVAAYVGLPEPYSASGYNSSFANGGTYYALTILYDDNRNPLAYNETKVNVLNEEQTQPTQPSLPSNPNNYGNDIDPNYNSVGGSQFTDITNQYWAFSAILDLNTRNVISGYPDGKFRPDKVVTRAEFAKIMVLAAGLTPAKVTKTSFSDIKATDWEAPFVEAAKSYLSGYKLSSGKLVFKPDAPATREDVAVAIVKLKGYNKTKLPDRTIIQAMFKDYNSISSYAKDYVALAIENNLVSGFPDETFRAQQPVTRAQAAAMLWRAYQYGDENKEESGDDEEVVDMVDGETVEIVEFPS